MAYSNFALVALLVIGATCVAGTTAQIVQYNQPLGGVYSNRPMQYATQGRVGAASTPITNVTTRTTEWSINPIWALFGFLVLIIGAIGALYGFAMCCCCSGDPCSCCKKNNGYYHGKGGKSHRSHYDDYTYTN